MTTKTPAAEALEDAARIAFENWYSDGDLGCASIRRNPDGGYYLMGAYCSWQAWRASWLYLSDNNTPRANKTEGRG